MLVALIIYCLSFLIDDLILYLSITFFFCLLFKFFNLNWKLFIVSALIMLSLNTPPHFKEKTCGVIVGINDKSYNVQTLTHMTTVVSKESLHFDTWLCFEGKYKLNLQSNKKKYQTYFNPKVTNKVKLPSIRRALWNYSEKLGSSRNILFSLYDESSGLIASQAWYVSGFVSLITWFCLPWFGKSKLNIFKKVFITFYYVFITQNVSIFRLFLSCFLPVYYQIILILIVYPKLNTSVFFILVYAPSLISALHSKINGNTIYIRALIISLSLKRLNILELLTMKYLRYYAGLQFLLTLVSLALTKVPSKLSSVDTLFIYLKTIPLEFVGKVPFIAIIVYLLLSIKNTKYSSIWMIVTYSFLFMSPLNKVVFINVGQGDATLFKTSFNRNNTLVDTGKPSAYLMLNDTLKTHGVRRLSNLVITHDDSDHSGNEIRIQEDYLIDKVVKKKNDPLDGFDTYLDDYVFKDKNDNSIILKSELDILMTGDASKMQEYLLSKDLSTQSRILKLGHHGSKTSSDYDFLKHVQPDLAIISSDPNAYGHPHIEVLKNLYDLRISFLETSKEGNISLYFIGPFTLIVSSKGLIGFI